MPYPLAIPPSRARRQFAMRLAQRKAALESARNTEQDPGLDDDDSGGNGNVSTHVTQEQEEREGHRRFARMFEEIDDSSDEEGEEDGMEVEVVRCPGGV